MDIQNEDDRKKAVRLYDKYRQLLYKIAYDILCDKAMAEDAVHGAFVKIIKNLHKIDENNCPQTRNYLVIICRSVSIDMNRRLKPELHIDDLPDTAPDTLAQDALSLVISGETVNELTEAIEKLPELYRDAVMLKHAYGHSTAEVAQILDISEDAAKKRITRAKKRIIEYLKGRYGYGGQ